MIVFIKNAVCPYSELCFLCGRGTHFQKIREKSGRKVKNGAKKRLDGKYDGYMRGLDGAEERKC